MRRSARTAAIAVTMLLCVSLWLNPSHSSQLTTQDNNTPVPGNAGPLFEKNCATCHGKDGRAKTFKAKFNHARNLTDAKWQAEVSDERLFNSITNGRGKMPAFGKKFSEAEVNSLVAYVRHLKK